ncbi:MAG: alpha/beta hydrolase [Rhodocyclaceae bacterium]|nr:alpha/beta hydrolase [Rhodocyclaceae bacterium]
MREGSVRCLSPAGFHNMAYVEWGDVANPRVLVCVHGLTRCGRDFDDLARAMSDRYRVVCPDVVGRGKSDWLRNPLLYGVPQYAADITVLLAQINGTAQVDSVHWVGTSMGGLIGMAVAAQPDTPVSRLVLNDVGPVVTAVSIARIAEYLGKAPALDSIAAAVSLVRAVSPAFGPHTDDEWYRLTVPLIRETAEGKFVFRYDPKIAEPFRLAMQESAGRDMELWPLYDAITCPTLLLRGAESDLLTRETAQLMTTRGPHAKLSEIAGVGHAPTLVHADQIAIVRDFL